MLKCKYVCINIYVDRIFLGIQNAVAKKKHAEKNLTAVVEKSSQFCTNVGISNIFVRPLRKYLLAYLA